MGPPWPLVVAYSRRKRAEVARFFSLKMQWESETKRVRCAEWNSVYGYK